VQCQVVLDQIGSKVTPLHHHNMNPVAQEVAITVAGAVEERSSDHHRTAEVEAADGAHWMTETIEGIPMGTSSRIAAVAGPLRSILDVEEV
jgi:hypothetical protein